MKVRWEVTECSWNDGGKTQYYIVILDQLQGHSGELVWAPELRVRGSLTVFPVPCLLSGPGGDLAVPSRSNGIELYHPSSTVLRTT